MTTNLKPNFSAAKLHISWTAAALVDGTGTTYGKVEKRTKKCKRPRINKNNTKINSSDNGSRFFIIAIVSFNQKDLDTLWEIKDEIKLASISCVRK